MKLAKRILFGALSALVMAGCSDDKIGTEGPDTNRPGQSENDGVYLRVNIKMPTVAGGRSWTDDENQSNDGTEVGKDSENNINTVYLVLAKASDNTFIGYGEIPASGITKSTDGTSYKSVASLSKTELADFYTTLGENESRDVNVYVFCNPTLSLRECLDKATAENPATNSWINGAGIYDISDPTTEIIWSENNFLMSNNSIAVRSLPQSIDQWVTYTDENTPFDLSGLNPEVNIDNSANNSVTPRGAVQVERAAARIDFKDGSPDGGARYYVVFPDGTPDAEKTKDNSLVDIVLNKMSLTNVAKQFYWLRRVSANGLNSDVSICGPELPWFTEVNNGLVHNKEGNYVVTPIAELMRTSPLPNDFADLHFNYPFFNTEGAIDAPVINNWYTSEISAVLGGEKDNWKDNSYHIWRYVTENAIPGAEYQKNGQSTGIVFKGKLVGTETALKSDNKNIAQLARLLNNELTAEDKEAFGIEKLTGWSNQDPIIYKFKGVRNDLSGMFASWPNVVEAAKQGACTPVWETDNTPEGGHWRIEVNRSYTLYAAVFGTGSCGSYTFTDPSTGESVTEPDPMTEVDKTAPNYFYDLWVEDGKKVPMTADYTDEFAPYFDFKNCAVEHGFTLYQTSFDGALEGEGEFGYYCYYYYWIRHNDNGQNGLMAPMEFATVRNNVYKIAVTAIRNIGHPRLTINDPDKPTPDTDDELDDVYLTVDVNVLPWVVRVNNAEF